MKILIGCENAQCGEVLIADLRRAGFPEDSEVWVVTAIESMAALAEEGFSAPHRASTEMGNSLQVDTTHLIEHTCSRATKVAEQLSVAFPRWKITPTGRIGAPQWALIDEAKKHGVDLMVLGSKGHSLINRILFGSTSHFLVNHSPCSVRIARFTEEHEVGPIRILVGVDGSPSSDAAIDAIIRRSWPTDTEICAVSVFDGDVLPLAVFENRHTEDAITEALEESRIALEQALELAGKKLEAAGLKVETRMKQGIARGVLMDEAKEYRPDTLFVGAKGHSLVDRLLIGSTSASLAAHAPCSVEIIR